LSVRFRSLFGLPEGRAEAAAHEAIDFWDEAGLYTASCAEALVTARIRLVAEIGAARYISRLGQKEQRDEVRRLLSQERAHEALLLAAALSAPVAEALMSSARNRRDRAFALRLAHALGDSGELPHKAMASLLEFLESELQRSSAEGPREKWEIAKALATLPVPLGEQTSVLKSFDETLPYPNREVARVAASFSWDIADGFEEEMLTVLALESFPDPGGRRKGIFLSRDDVFDDTVLRSAEHLLPKRPELAPDVLAARKRATMRGAERLGKLLDRCGHSSLIADERRKQREMFLSLVQGVENSEDKDEKLLKVIADLGRPVELTNVQRRRCDELAKFRS
jgi:hypothetical protein